MRAFICEVKHFPLGEDIEQISANQILIGAQYELKFLRVTLLLDMATGVICNLLLKLAHFLDLKYLGLLKQLYVLRK